MSSTSPRKSHTLVIASRQSALARLQSYAVGAALKEAWPHLKIEYLFKESLGDKNLDAPLWQMPEKGVFTRDLQVDLEAGNCDMVVHSWKDLPLEMPDSTQIAATLAREDCRDLLLVKRSFLKTLSPGASVDKLTLLSSSPRRAHNLGKSLESLLPFECKEIAFEAVRGNVPTRVAKLLKHPDAAGLILARAALERLLAPCPTLDLEVQNFQVQLRADLLQCEWMILPARLNPTAPAQGALAIEIRKDREDLRVLLERIHHPEDFRDVLIEREVLAHFGGGCHQKIGANVLRLGSDGQRVLILKGQRESGETLDFEGFVEDFPYPLRSSPSVPRLKSEGPYWPASNGDREAVFRRVPLAPLPQRESLGVAPLLFVVGRSEAVPEGWHFLSEDRVFSAGIESWKKLAARGIWVHASFEGLGETRAQSKLFPPALRTYKFSHEKAPSIEGEILIPTYRLEVSRPHDTIVPPGTQECFWMSSTLFEEALRRDPELLSRVRVHACGPGHTLRSVAPRVQAAGGKCSVYLGLEHWRSSRENASCNEKVNPQ